MRTYELAGGVSVQFPYDAYEPQLLYMQTVIEALQKGENALLESPTGTGKTLCLLCATLAWRSILVANSQLQAASSATYEMYLGQQAPLLPTQNNTLAKLNALSAGRRPPLIIYASRTHSQLAQVISELEKTGYRPKIAVIGSREQLCINPLVRELKSNSAMNMVCGQLVKKNACEMYSKVGEGMKRLEVMKAGGDLVDMEDIIKAGINHSACPFYMAKGELMDAELVFMPYNYLVDRKAHGLMQSLDLKDAVIIFDEAHNMENVCGEASSTEISLSDLRMCLCEIEKIKEMYRSGHCVDNGMNSVAIDHATVMLKRVISELGNLKLDNDKQFLHRGEFIVDFFKGAGINEDNVSSTVMDLDSISRTYLESEYNQRKNNVSCSIQRFTDALRTIFGISSQKQDGDNRLMTSIEHDRKFFRVFAKVEKVEHTLSKQSSLGEDRTICYWCFNPGVALSDLLRKGVYNIILTSGTLSPLRSFTAELQVPFPHQLENSHVVGGSQIFCNILKAGPTGIGLNSSYQQRNSDLYKKELGRSILSVCRVVPDGVLVFFPSYTNMEQCITSWKVKEGGELAIWERISSLKYPVMEPRTKGDFSKIMNLYYSNVSNGKGAIFFAVCRGKVSEGLDFADANGRAVIITGIPFPPLKDPRVILKRQYLDELNKDGNRDMVVISGEEWYSQQALRAVNQAIGRVIRHRNDFGAILLFDERFSAPRIIGQLSKWLTPHVKVQNDFGEMITRLDGFFGDKQQRALEEDFTISQSFNQADNMLASFDQTRRVIDDARLFFNQGERVLPSLEGQENTLPIDQSKKMETFTKAFTTKPPLTPDLKKELCQQAHTYLDKIKTRFTSESTREFNIILKLYRAKQIQIEELITKVLNIFEEEKALDLISGFRTFVSIRHCELFDKMVEERLRSITPIIGKRPANDLIPDMTLSVSTTTMKKSCPICTEQVNNGYRAKCGHVCCFACWNSWLQVKLECPLCRLRTRIPQLKKAFS